MTRVAIISPSEFPGTSGNSSHYIELINSLVNLGTKITLICPYATGWKEFDSNLKADGIRVIRIPLMLPRLRNFHEHSKITTILQMSSFYLVETLVVLFALIRWRLKYCIIRHSMLTFHLGLFLTLFRVRSLADGSLITSEPNSPTILKVIERLTIRKYSLYRVLSSRFVPLYLNMGYPSNRIRIIPVAINTNDVPSTPLDNIEPFTFGFFGVLENWQGLDVLIKSFGQVVKQIPSSKLLVIGRGSMLSEIKEMISHLDLADNVQIYDAVSREELFSKFFNRFRVTVIPSKAKEAFPMKLIEALAAGKPVIMTSVGGVVEHFNAEDGVLLIPPNNVEALALTMSQLIKNEKEQIVLSQKAKIAARKFDSSKIFPQILHALLENNDSTNQRVLVN